MMINYLTVVFSFCFLVIITAVISDIVAANDTITVTEPLRDGGYLVSSGGTFKLGFVNLGNSNRWYVCITWSKVSQMTPVWVANRDTPLTDSSGILQMSNHSTLEILNSTGHVIWSTNSTKSTLKKPVAQLLDSGNLVIRDEGNENPENFIWQSFDHPCDVLLAGMKLGLDLETGMEWYLTSWRSSDDPAPGAYTNRLDTRGYPEFVVVKGNVTQYRYGPWNGLRFSGIPQMQPADTMFRYWYVINQKEIYFTYKLLSTKLISHLVITPDGSVQRVEWNENTHEWVLFLAPQSNTCDSYATCGVFGICNEDYSTPCECLKGFVPKDKEAWNAGDWLDGCVRRTKLACNKTGDGFWKISNVKVPETRFSWYNMNMSLEECKQLCLENCSCSAYSNLDLTHRGSGCLLWFGDLKDITEFTKNGQDLFIRLASSEIGTSESASSERRKWVIVGCTLLSSVLLLSLGVALWIKKKKLVKKQGCDPKDSDLPVLNFPDIAKATNNFSPKNKIGEGGFGVVYKGTLKGGQDIAVKKLLKESNEGLDEFMNEVIFIAKLQHRNLVKLIGCAIGADERLLVYEYMPNKGLDSFIFEQGQKTSLDWSKRFNIIDGIARGLLYLHQDSRLRIVHRDLKASNVLLDHDLNPKISDFGTARCFHGNETLAKTRRVIGTYGYMSPEYAVEGIFSVKSDVFSFGVLVLEIISGVRNRGFIHQDHHLNLLGHAWRLFLDGEAMKLIGMPVNNVSEVPQIQRSIHVGLLCVQKRPEDRPTMSSIVVMLSSEGELPQPKQPGFFTERNWDEKGSTSSKAESLSTNESSLLMLLIPLESRRL